MRIVNEKINVKTVTLVMNIYCGQFSNWNNVNF